MSKTIIFLKRFIIMMLLTHSYSFAFDDLEKGFNAVMVAKNQFEEVQKKIKVLKVLSFLDSKSVMSQKSFTVLDWYEDSNINVEMDSGCKLNMSIMPNGLIKPGFIKSEYQLRDFKDSDLKLYNKLVLLHELSHCEYNIMDKFYLERKSPKKQEKLNKLFDIYENDKTKVVINDLVRMQMENFADTLAAMMLIKINGNNQQTKDVINLLLKSRYIEALVWKENKISYTVHAYDTKKNIEKVLTNKELIINMAPEDLKVLALKWSSEYLLETINQKAFNFRKQIPYNLGTAIAIEKFNQIYSE